MFGKEMESLMFCRSLHGSRSSDSEICDSLLSSELNSSDIMDISGYSSTQQSQNTAKQVS